MLDFIVIAAGFGGLIGHLGEHLAGHIAHEKYRELERHIYDRVPGLAGLPKNHDVARTVRTAELQALALVVRDFKKHRPYDPDAKPTGDVHKWHASNALDEFIERANEFVRASLASHNKSGETADTETSQSIKEGEKVLLDALKAPQGTANGGAHLRKLAEDAVLAELAKFARQKVPPTFEQHFRGDAGGKTLDWFTAYSACLAEQVKTNERFRSVLEMNLLGDLTRLGLQTHEVIVEIEAQAGLWSSLLQELPETLNEINARTKKIDSKLDELIAALEAKKGIPREALISHLVRLGAREDIADDDIPKFLEKFAEEFQIVRDQVAPPGNGDPDILNARAKAASLFDAGDLDGSKALLAEARTRISALRQERQREEADLIGDEARIDRLELNYQAAADKYGEAAKLASFDAKSAFRFLLEQGNTLQAQGDEFGDNSALRTCVVVWRRAAKLQPVAVDRDNFAAAQNGLGNALQTLGDRENGTRRLNQAAAAYRKALVAYGSEHSAPEWSMTQNNLGNVLRSLGERAGKSKPLIEAVTAFRAALTERTRERDAPRWAMTQTNLASALAALGELDTDTGRLEEAVKIFREALEVYTREAAQFQWAATQNNLSTALASLGERKGDPEQLMAAVTAVREALQVYTFERTPPQWAATQHNLGAALVALGKHGGGTTELVDAASAYREALKFYTREHSPPLWKITQESLKMVEKLLSERSG
jgi:tetratricopeptide (TPR) repeat protein